MGGGETEATGRGTHRAGRGTRRSAGQSTGRRTRRSAGLRAAVRGLAATLGVLALALGAAPTRADEAPESTPEAAPAPAALPGPALGLAVGIDALRWRDALDLSAEFDAYARLGVRWLRTDLNWSLVQAAGPDSYDWSTFDRVLALARARGIAVLPVPGSAPDWARTDGGAPDPQAFARFVAAAVARYAPQGVRAWEIWNEPNMAGFWPPEPDPAAYAALLRAAAAAIRAADPQAFVISGGLASAVETGPPGAVEHYAAVDFLREMYAAGAGGAFDALGHHPYSYPLTPGDPVPWNGWTMMTGPIRELMTANGDGAKPIWITEYGAPTAGRNGVSPQAQAAMLEEALARVRDLPWAGPLFWYSYRDLGTDPADAELHFGLVDAAGAPKPAHAAFAARAAAPARAALPPAGAP